MADEYIRLRRVYGDISMTRDFAATDGNLTLVSGKANYTIFIQKIIITFSTVAAQSVTFQDSNGTPLYVAKVDATPIIDAPYTFDFGGSGKQLTQGKDFVQAMTAGNAGHVEVYGYIKLTASTFVAF